MSLLLKLALGLALWCAANANATAERRVSLIIGNGAYAHAPHLPNPSHDAQEVAAALKRTGFETILGIDLDQAGMQDATIRFARAARDADVAIFYYSGHAMQYSGVNYLMPVDAKLTDEADFRRMARLDDIVADLQQARNVRILVLDSCRNNPLAEELKRSIGRTRAASVQRGLAKIDTPEGMVIAYATQAGRTAEDGTGRNSPYTTAFLRHIEKPEEIGAIFRHISADVYEATHRTQLPELSLSLIGDYYLNGRPQPGQTSATAEPATTGIGPTQPAFDPRAIELSYWESVRQSNSITAVRSYLKQYPNGTFAPLASARLQELEKEQEPSSPQQVTPSLVPRTSQRAGIDCTKPGEPIEHLICADADLAEWDGRLDQAYRRKLARTNDKKLVRRQERDWIEQRSRARH